LLGFTAEQVHRPVWSQATPSQIIGTKVVTPDEIRLTYAALGDAATKQAVLAVYIDELQAAQLAVAVPTSGGWERVASLNCWCKYEMSDGIDTLSAFLQLERAPGNSPNAPQAFELVVRVSGGGSGLYDQTEKHFRIFHHELHQALSFTSRRRSCDGTASPPLCTVDRQWLLPVQLASGPGAVLVHAEGKFPELGGPPAWWSIRDLEIEKLGRASCTTFLWVQANFTYAETRQEENPCTPKPD